MTPTIDQNISKIQELFTNCPSPEARYEKIISLGKNLDRLEETECTENRRVQGCQSRLYLKTTFKDGSLFFKVQSDALISIGLAALLLKLLNGQTPESILKTDLSFLEKLGIISSLSPNRANGLFSLHLKIKQDALQYLHS